MDETGVFMEWTQAITVILSIFGMIVGMVLFMVREMRQISREITTESRDFHGRLCRLEERYIDLRQKEKK